MSTGALVQLAPHEARAIRAAVEGWRRASGSEDLAIGGRCSIDDLRRARVSCRFRREQVLRDLDDIRTPSEGAALRHALAEVDAAMAVTRRARRRKRIAAPL